MNESKHSNLRQKQEEGLLVPFSAENQRIKDSVGALYALSKTYNIKSSEIYQAIKAYADYLKEKYPDYFHHAVYHVLISSGLNSNTNPIIEEDFPGEDSVEKFIESLAERLKSKYNPDLKD